jgi:hypothetical protein
VACDEVPRFNPNSQHTQRGSEVQSSTNLQDSGIAAGIERAEMRHSAPDAGKWRYCATRKELQMS